MNLNRSRLAWSFAILTLFSGVAVTVFDVNTVQSADEKAAEKQVEAAVPAAAPQKSVIKTSAANACLSDPVVLEEINKKQQEIEAKQKELQSKEAEFKAREAAINDELKKLSDMRDEIAKLDEGHRKQSAEKVAKVVETLQTMSPKSSATMLQNLDDGLAVAAISQMDTVKLAKIMNVIDPKRAAKLTELLAGVVRARNSAGNSSASNDAAETAASSQVAISPSASASKKGEITNDNNKPESIISGGPDLASKTAK